VRYALLVVGVLAFVAGLATTVIAMLDVVWGLLLCPDQAILARYFCSQSVREGAAVLVAGLCFNAGAYFALRYRDRRMAAPAA
jgi:hypothetical protein